LLAFEDGQLPKDVAAVVVPEVDNDSLLLPRVYE
jgi:hypothetical protein